MLNKYFLKQVKKQTLALSLMFASFAFAQTYPDLEMGNVTANPSTSSNFTVALQKDTNNNTATSLVNYTTPSALTVNFNVNLNSFTTGVRFGSNGVTPFYDLMNVIGNAVGDNTQYTMLFYTLLYMCPCQPYVCAPHTPSRCSSNCVHSKMNAHLSRRTQSLRRQLYGSTVL